MIGKFQMFIFLDLLIIWTVFFVCFVFNLKEKKLYHSNVITDG